MKKLIVFRAYQAGEELDNIEVQQVINYFTKLDGTKNTGLMVDVERKYLTLIRSSQQRFHIRYAEVNEQHHTIKAGILLDNSKYPEVEIKFLLSNGQIDSIPMNETVDSNTAQAVLLQFWENETFPEGLEWDGNM